VLSSERTRDVAPVSWTCPVCEGGRGVVRWPVPEEAVEGGVAPAAFRPSSDRYGRTVGSVVRCLGCGHGSLARLPDANAMGEAYVDAADPISLSEEAGQIETARRALRLIERIVRPSSLADVGCWTGSLLVAASESGWDACGVDPSQWAVTRAQERGLHVWAGDFRDPCLGSRTYRAIAMCDVLEHLRDPGDAIEHLRGLVEPGGLLYLTVPDAGSVVARLLGRRWWSILPMHLQYFTRSSIRRLLEERGFVVHEIRSHAKVFSARYYAERLHGYSPLLGRLTVKVVEASGLGSRLVAPDLFDRMQVIASR